MCSSLPELEQLKERLIHDSDGRFSAVFMSGVDSSNRAASFMIEASPWLTYQFLGVQEVAAQLSALAATKCQTFLVRPGTKTCWSNLQGCLTVKQAPGTQVESKMKLTMQFSLVKLRSCHCRHRIADEVAPAGLEARPAWLRCQRTRAAHCNSRQQAYL